ncbi:MAG TPA: alpha/beta hydrolase [Candidatus Limnocylindrales bacterium]|nr:alpha/beta hydrolase [Candidatus Limnocylindrales bacterium]
MEFSLDLGDLTTPATLDAPDGPCRGGVVVTHGGQAPQRDYFLYEHLAKVLPPQGFAVLRYERRPSPVGDDIPFDRQAADAVVALRHLRSHIGAGLAVGLWGVSQGGWAAPFTAATYPDEVDFVVACSAPGVSPGQQMRYGTERQLRRHGFGDAEVAELLRVRSAAEEFLRGNGDRDTAQGLIDSVTDRPWFQYAYLPPELPPEPGAWVDMDHDPAPIFERVTCPVLAVYGETDAWVPIDESIGVWRRALPSVEIFRVPGCDHLLSFEDREEVEAVSPDYTKALIAWLERRTP